MTALDGVSGGTTLAERNHAGGAQKHTGRAEPWGLDALWFPWPRDAPCFTPWFAPWLGGQRADSLIPPLNPSKILLCTTTRADTTKNTAFRATHDF